MSLTLSRNALACGQEAHDHLWFRPSCSALVHEAYLRLVGSGDSEKWDGRGHFFSVAAEAMRRILVEAARRRQSQKHGRGVIDIDIDLVLDEIQLKQPPEEIVAISVSARKSHRVELSELMSAIEIRSASELFHSNRPISASQTIGPSVPRPRIRRPLGLNFSSVTRSLTLSLSQVIRRVSTSQVLMVSLGPLLVTEVT